MFLFDRERTGRIPSSTSFEEQPQEAWRILLKQEPIRCAESTPVFDEHGNLYFGSHNGSIYALSPDGKVLWQFVTEVKVYSSPMLVDGKLYFGCNMSTLLCLSLQGELLWQFDGYKAFAKQSKLKRLFLNLYNYRFYDYEFKKFMKINTWTSPNLVAQQYVAFVFYGIGLVLLDKDTGKVHWQYDLGRPSFHLAGVAVTHVNGKDYIAVCGQNSGLHWLDETGKLLWKTNAFRGSNAWANPSIDAAEGCIYHTESFHNKKSILYKTDFSGKTIWKKQFSFGCRASVGISTAHFIVFLGLNGTAYFLDKATGKEVASQLIASKDRGLWTSPAIMANQSVLINTKKTVQKGSLVCLQPNGAIQWEIFYAKALSVPTIDAQGRLYTATWAGDFYQFKTKES